MRDHPRACGEKLGVTLLLWGFMGSPPRIRGKAPTRDRLSIVQRITPAHAGKSDTCPIRSGDSRDHPRACGEKLNCSLNGFAIRGSPPRMRGKALRRGASLFRNGITPAHAGKSSLPSIYCRGSWDHPRACGEKRQNPRQKARN